jgi:hypothetical protein
MIRARKVLHVALAVSEIGPTLRLVTGLSGPVECVQWRMKFPWSLDHGNYFLYRTVHAEKAQPVLTWAAPVRSAVLPNCFGRTLCSPDCDFGVEDEAGTSIESSLVDSGSFERLPTHHDLLRALATAEAKISGDETTTISPSALIVRCTSALRKLLKVPEKSDDLNFSLIWEHVSLSIQLEVLVRAPVVPNPPCISSGDDGRCENCCVGVFSSVQQKKVFLNVRFIAAPVSGAIADAESATAQIIIYYHSALPSHRPALFTPLGTSPYHTSVAVNNNFAY